MKPRIRSIKPEVLQDERLWDLALETGMPVLQAFVGLWCYADREGRFEWRPRALRPLLLPYWEGGDASFEALLQALERARFIVRYEVGDRAYGYVRNFHKHQVVNQREAKSDLPPPPVTETHVHAHAEPSRGPDPARGEGNGRELKGKGEGGSREDAPRSLEVPEVPGLQIVSPLPAPVFVGLQPSQRDRDAARPPGKLRHKYEPEWSPRQANQARGHELGLTDEEIWARWDACRNKRYQAPFDDDEDQFMRELAWAAQDKTTKQFTSRKERDAFEMPGRERRA